MKKPSTRVITGREAAARFAHFLGLPKRAPKPAEATSNKSRAPKTAARIEPQLPPAKPHSERASSVSNFSHLRPPAPPPPSPTEQLERRGAAARAAVAAYNHANGTASRTTATASPARPANILKPNSPASRAVAIYNRALGRD